MATICNLVPLTEKGEESDLYKGLLSYTANNRKLCNFLYASAIQKEFLKKCKPSELNAQREPSIKKVVEAFDIEEMLDTTVKIEQAHNELGTAIDGEPILFEELDAIFDRVVEFNDRPNNVLRAVIRYSKGKYFVDVDVVNDSNFAINSRYKAGKQQLEILKDQFKSIGLNTEDWSKFSRRCLNPNNTVFFVEDTLKKYMNLKYQKISVDEAALLLDLFKDHAQVIRLKSIYGEYTAEALSFLLSRKPTTAVPPSLEPFRHLLGTNSQGQRLVNNFRDNTVKKAFKGVNPVVLKEAVVALYKNTLTEEESAIRECLQELYKKYHLDKDTLQIDMDKLNSMEDLTRVIIIKLHNTIEVLKARHIASADELSVISEKTKELEDKIAKKEYTLSIIQFLEEITDVLEDVEAIDKDAQYEMHDLNSLASEMLALEEKIDAYLPVVSKLKKREILQQELEDTDINDIIERATSTEAKLRELKSKVQEKKFAFAYNYLHRWWGADQHYTGMGQFDMVLESCLHTATVDMNIFDRYILSATEVHDPVLATLASSIKNMHERRDKVMAEIDFDIRKETDALYQSGSNSDFMYETSSNGSIRIVSDIDWDTYYQQRREYKEQLEVRGLKGNYLKRKMQEWEDANTGDYILNLKSARGVDQTIKLARIPKVRKALPSMTPQQRRYYESMLCIKYEMEMNLENQGVKTFLFRPVQMPKSMEESYSNMSPAEVFQALKRKFTDWKVSGSDYGVQERIINANGETINSIPVFYISKLEDQNSLSRNFSKSMMAFCGMAVNHSIVSEQASILELTKQFLLDRKVEASEGGKPIVQSVEALGLRMRSKALVKSSETPIKGWLQDLYEASLYGKRHKISDYGENAERAIKTAVGYTSATGLVMNLPGAVANVLVGKLQMIIEAGGNEFANFKDYGVAEAQYWHDIPEVIGEVWSNNKKSRLGLMLQRFDAMDDFYDKLREAGFHKSALGKIVGNSSLFFMYGLGEHLLHAQNMLAVLNHTKVKAPDGSMTTLYHAFEVEVEGNNGKLKLKDGYTYSYKESKDSQEIWLPVNDAYVDIIKKRVGYVNRTCNGAFGADEKGAIHRYAFGRLLMNFRQWMPAHYARRFNTLHYDADLGEVREGYYVTFWKFAKSLVQDVKNHQFDWETRKNQLTKMEKANLNRAFTESCILVLFVILSRMGLGDDPKHRTWAEAFALYQIQRCKLETGASTPLYAGGFVKNIFTIVNSPAAAINTMQKLTPLLNIDELITGEKYESGTHIGEYKYLHRVERAVPFYSQVNRWWNMDIDDSIFGTFKD